MDSQNNWISHLTPSLLTRAFLCFIEFILNYFAKMLYMKNSFAIIATSTTQTEIKKMLQKSKTIGIWCERNSDLVEEYYRDTDGHWILFKEGLVHEEMECGTVREDTVSEAMPRLKRSLILTEKEFYGD